jgi:hypothetical protein
MGVQWKNLRKIKLQATKLAMNNAARIRNILRDNSFLAATVSIAVDD